ncbi:H-NS family nucleoid-associated regulatory protein [Ralstonia chuxiongensis]|uniref:H-NS family nucleoid-associated regulatory protein n=1 Tax=Ralstonia chuxiongensis TaxID=2957504 RepID=UPI0028F55671|nr:H-NS family nucleoid-associated regulatory protein [Ralstonia chuxiongensis]CAJ0780326.1 hypothetical protein R8510_04729 [Ralstonia chuxiongensis]
MGNVRAPQAPRGRAEALAWVREQIALFELTYEQLRAAGAFAPPPKAAVAYRNAQGQTWDRKGAMPDWLQRAVNAGQSVEHFRVAE